jgi:hypothetical protein
MMSVCAVQVKTCAAGSSLRLAMAYPATLSAGFCRDADGGSTGPGVLLGVAKTGDRGTRKKSVHDFRFCQKFRLAHPAHVAESRESALSRFANCAPQMPSFAFNSAFTACGLALPPVAFMA